MPHELAVYRRFFQALLNLRRDHVKKENETSTIAEISPSVTSWHERQLRLIFT